MEPRNMKSAPDLPCCHHLFKTKEPDIKNTNARRTRFAVPPANFLPLNLYFSGGVLVPPSTPEIHFAKS
ncbi:hypothetical protein VNO77_03578 [Canavalia gladiata]|uniref:Uncharacterized protein n=1 Tax=Canavalia gladiata TaxID=3824 RepID=A0AAN9MUX6_CANGL